MQLERSKSRESALEVTFGLKVRIKALRDVDAVLNSVKLKSGTIVEATLEDRIVFHNDSEMDLIDLRRRATYGISTIAQYLWSVSMSSRKSGNCTGLRR